MKFKRQRRDTLAVNLTPLIDVVLLLLIFFMVSTSFTDLSELVFELVQRLLGGVHREDHETSHLLRGEAARARVRERRSQQLRAPRARLRAGAHALGAGEDRVVFFCVVCRRSGVFGKSVQYLGIHLKTGEPRNCEKSPPADATLLSFRAAPLAVLARARDDGGVHSRGGGEARLSRQQLGDHR